MCLVDYLELEDSSESYDHVHLFQISEEGKQISLSPQHAAVLTHACVSPMEQAKTLTLPSPKPQEMLEPVLGAYPVFLGSLYGERHEPKLVLSVTN